MTTAGRVQDVNVARADLPPEEPGSVMHETEERIARRLSEARRDRGWTLSQAADRVGVSSAHLSRLEKGNRQPSIGVLIQLARCYNLSLGQLVGEEPRASCHVFRQGEVPVHEGPDGSYATLSGLTSQDLLESLRLDLPAKSRTSPGARHVGEEWLFVLSGNVLLEHAGESIELASGDAAHFDSATPHRIHNAEATGATVLLVSACTRRRREGGHL